VVLVGISKLVFEVFNVAGSFSGFTAYSGAGISTSPHSIGASILMDMVDNTSSSCVYYKAWVRDTVKIGES
jgi:hypothetical protein